MRRSIARWARAAAAFAAAAVVPAAVPAAGGKDICYMRQADGFWQVWLTDATGQRHARLTKSPVDKVRCSWLGREQKLVVTTAAGAVLVVDGKGGAERTLDVGGHRVTDAVGLADGKGIAFSMPGAGIDTDDVFVLRFDEKQPLRVTRQPYLEHFPVPCPDGTTLLYAGGRGDDRHDIFRRSVGDPNAEATTLTDGVLYNFEPSCGKSGAVVFSSNRSGDGNYDLWTIPAAGGSPVRLTDEPGLDGHPSWSPDETFVVFESGREGHRAIYLLDAAAKKVVRRLTPAGVAARAPAWSWR